MMASFVFACVVASPIIIWQAWAFIAAGLYHRERRLFYRYFPFMMLLLVIGVSFGYFLALPYGLGWLIRMMVDGLVTSMLTVGNYFTFLFSVTAAMGLIFQLPLVMVALQRIGLVRHRTYVKHWRWFVLIICALSAVLTPPDPFSMAFMAMPTLLLYGLGLLLTRFGRRHERTADAGAPAPEAAR
jgi:Tat protein translocase TatC